MSQNETVAVPFINLALQHRQLREELHTALDSVIDHGLFILGPETTEFEERFAAFSRTTYAVGVDNGTNALILSLLALGVGAGDEVITVPNSFLASASAIALTGARPVFVDVRNDYTLDWTQLESAITPRTKAILPVHLTGRPADMGPIMEIAARHNLHVAEDCAQAAGARLNGQPVGSFGIAGCFSLHPLKNLGALGDGGVITTNDPDFRAILLKYRNHGLVNRDSCAFWGFNSRLDTLQAALLLRKMEHLDSWNERRRAIASLYRRQLSDVVSIVEDPPSHYSVYQTFIIETPEREPLRDYLKSCGIETKIHYPIPIHLQQAAEGLGYRQGSFPVTELQSRRILSLPIYPELTEGQQTHVISSIRDFFADHNRR